MPRSGKSLSAANRFAKTLIAISIGAPILCAVNCTCPEPPLHFELGRAYEVGSPSPWFNNSAGLDTFQKPAAFVF